MKVVLAAAAVCAALAVLPAAASADATVDAATAARKALNLGTLTAMPSGSTAYRTIEQYGSEMDALAAANPGFVSVKSAPYTTLEGRTAKYLEITNNVGAETTASRCSSSWARSTATRARGRGRPGVRL